MSRTRTERYREKIASLQADNELIRHYNAELVWRQQYDTGLIELLSRMIPEHRLQELKAELLQLEHEHVR